MELSLQNLSTSCNPTSLAKYQDPPKKLGILQHPVFRHALPTRVGKTSMSRGFGVIFLNFKPELSAKIARISRLRHLEGQLVATTLKHFRKYKCMIESMMNTICETKSKAAELHISLSMTLKYTAYVYTLYVR